MRVARHLRHPVRARLNSVDGLVITLLDVLSGLDQLKICTGYTVGGQPLAEFPDDPVMLEQARPVLEDLEPWTEDISGAKTYRELPRATRRYVKRVEEVIGAPVRIISVGPSREQTIFRG